MTDSVGVRPLLLVEWARGQLLLFGQCGQICRRAPAPHWDDDTATGAYGAGSLATAANGQVWLEAAIAEKIAHVAEIHEQHRRQEARRNSGFGLWGSVTGGIGMNPKTNGRF